MISSEISSMLKKIVKYTATLGTVLALSACGVSNAVTSDGKLVGEPRHESFESNTHTRGKGSQMGIMVSGPFDPILKRVKIGTSKDAVMYGGNSWGAPHYHEGYGSRLLTYNFSNTEGWICQIKLGFDKNARVGSIHDYPLGCAAQVEQKVPERIVQHPQTRKIELKAGALFNFDQATLRPEYSGELQRLAKVVGDLSANGQINRIVVVGHTDQSGTDAYNQGLSEARAKTVANYLVAHGAPANAMHVVGLGESEPIKDCGNAENPSEATKQCNFENRRVEIFVNGNQVVEQLESF